MSLDPDPPDGWTRIDELCRSGKDSKAYRHDDGTVINLVRVECDMFVLLYGKGKRKISEARKNDYIEALKKGMRWMKEHGQPS